jgi:hypothetical protein
MLTIFTSKMAHDLIVSAEAQRLVLLQRARQPLTEQRARLIEATRAATEVSARYYVAKGEWMKGAAQ